MLHEHDQSGLDEKLVQYTDSLLMNPDTANEPDAVKSEDEMAVDLLWKAFGGHEEPDAAMADRVLENVLIEWDEWQQEKKDRRFFSFNRSTFAYAAAAVLVLMIVLVISMNGAGGISLQGAAGGGSGIESIALPVIGVVFLAGLLVFFWIKRRK